MGANLLPQTFSIKTKSWSLTLPPELQARLGKTFTGEGGWQSLMADIQAHRDGATLELPEALVHRMVPKAVVYGAGGYQSVIRWILCLLLEQHGPAILGEPQTLKSKAAKQAKGA